MTAPTPPDRPLYKGAPLEPERGPGLGCFWTQAILLAIVLVLIPLGVGAGWSIFLTGGLLVVALVLVFFTSLTTIFLLRLVSADRRSRRRPLSGGARPTVGQLEDASASHEDPIASPDREPNGDSPGGMRQ